MHIITMHQYQYWRREFIIDEENLYFMNAIDMQSNENWYMDQADHGLYDGEVKKKKKKLHMSYIMTMSSTTKSSCEKNKIQQNV